MPAQTQEHTLLVWSLAFFLIENVDESHLGANFTTTVIQGALSQIAQNNTTSNKVHGAILKVSLNCYKKKQQKQLKI